MENGKGGCVSGKGKGIQEIYEGEGDGEGRKSRRKKGTGGGSNPQGFAFY